MTEKELRHLNRTEILALLLAQMEENAALKKRIGELETELAERKIAIDNAGSIAEAALALNGVFEAAQAAADQYLENIQRSDRARIREDGSL